MPPNLRPGERRSEEARRQHFCYLTFRGYHQAGNTIVRNEYLVQSLLSFVVGWPRRVLTNLHVHAVLAFSSVRLSTVLVCVLVVDLSTHFFDWTMEVMCGAMLATSGPVSMLARIEVGAILRLTTIISGEIIMNDKGAFVVVTPSAGGLRAPGFPVWSMATFSVVSSVRCCGPWPVLHIGSVPKVLTLHSNRRGHFGHSLARLVVVRPFSRKFL